jgi:hypothetical protein
MLPFERQLNYKKDNEGYYYFYYYILREEILEKLGLVKEEPRTHITVMQWSLLE